MMKKNIYSTKKNICFLNITLFMYAKCLHRLHILNTIHCKIKIQLKPYLSIYV